MDAVQNACRANLPAGMRRFESRQTMNLLKIHFNANYRIHYEVMISAERGVIELGLHFEDGPESTSRLLELFDRHVIEIKHELGSAVELERWTPSWGHICDMRPTGPLTATFAAELGERLAEMIVVLQPILDDAFERGLAAREPGPSRFKPRMGRRA